MKVYLVIIEDRHTDAEVRVFLELEHAIIEAGNYLDNQARRRGVTPREYYGLGKDQYKRMRAGQDYIIRLQPPGRDGVHLHASYSPEEDFVTVKEVEVVDAEEGDDGEDANQG